MACTTRACTKAWAGVWGFLVLLAAMGGCQHGGGPTWQNMITAGELPGLATSRTSSSSSLQAGDLGVADDEELRMASARQAVASPSVEDSVSSSSSSSLTLPAAAEEEEGGVVVSQGYVCVPEKSAAADGLAALLEQGLSEDLSQALPDQKVSEIDPIEVVDHPDVQKWMNHFLSQRSMFQRYLDRGANFQKLVSHVLEEEGLPPELFYLAMVESGFRPTARSSASAVGIWQFIRSTGKRYGLKVNYYVDERKDPVRATRAAARYLASLYRVYQSWELAAAAYNAGENRVLSAIMRGHTRDFWELSSRKLLPRETRNYVPKMMAAIKIGSNLEKHNFKFEVTDNYGIPVAAKVPGGVFLKHVASVAGVTEKSLRTLNPHLRRGLTPPGSSYKVWVPQNQHVQRLARSYSSLSKKRQRVVRNSSKVPGGYHLVRRGQNLEGISKRYGLTVRELKKLNGMRGTLIYAGQKLRVSKAEPSSGRIYVVKKGDTLYSIAKRYSTSVRSLQRKNQIAGSLVLVGQKIRL